MSTRAAEQSLQIGIYLADYIVQYVHSCWQRVLYTMTCVCVRACVRAGMRASGRASGRACVATGL